MSQALLFVLVFVGGPLAFRALSATGPSPRAFGRVALFTALCAATALALRYGLAELWGRNLLVTGAAMLFIWGGWIGAIAHGAQVLRRADPGLPMRRWTSVMGTVGTTMPWFGLASASMIAG